MKIYVIAANLLLYLTIVGALGISMLLVITTSFPVKENKASGIFVFRMAESLGKKVEVEVLTPASTLSHTKTQDSGLNVYFFSYFLRSLQRLTHLPGGIPAQIKRQPLYLLVVPFFMLSLLISTWRRSKHNSILLCNWTICGLVGGMVAKLRKKKSYCVLRGEDFTRSLQSLLSRLLLKTVIRLNDKIFCVSSEMYQSLIAANPSAEAKIHFVPNGVQKLTVKKVDNLLVFVGSLIPRKDPFTFLKACADILESHSFKVEIVGEGYLENDLKQFVNKHRLDDAITFCGQLSPIDTLEKISSARCLVLSSVSEGRPNVVLEAMANRTLVVASDIAGTRELINPEVNGFLFPVGNVEALSANMAKALELTPENTSRLDQAERKISQDKLTWADCAERYLQLMGVV